MQSWKKLPRLILFVTLLVSVLASLSAPVFVEETVSAAPLSANALDVIVSEVGWGGNAFSANDEWIELYNPTSSAINLASWTLISADAVPSISLTGTIPPGGYFLLERDDDLTVSDIQADQIYTGALGNGGEFLTLTDNLGNTIDTVNISGGAWDGGSGSPNYFSMERTGVVADSAAAWFTNDGITRNGLAADGNPINGTPYNSDVIDLSLTKIVDNATQSVGNNVQFTITVTNSGPNDATNVTVRDLLPAGLAYVSDSSGGVSYNSGTGIWTVGTLANGANATLDIIATVTSNGAKTNSAEVWSVDQVDSDSTAGNASTTEDDDASVTVTPPGPVLTLNITNVVNNSTPAIGSNVVFTITVNNPNTNATGVTVNALLPAGLTYISHSAATGAYVSGTGVWAIGNLAGGASTTLNVTARVVTSGTKNYVATVSSNEYANSSSTAVVNPVASTEADLSISQTWNRSTSALDTAQLSITVTNNSTGNAATGVQVRDLLPSGLTYISHTTGMTYNSGTGIWAVGTLAGGATSTLVITVRVAASGTSTSSLAEVWLSDQFDPDSTPGNGDTAEDDDESVEVLIADLSLTEIVDISGSNAIFTITIRNDGPDDASGIIVKNSRLATSYTFVSYGSTAGTYDSGTGDWTIPTLLDGATATLIVTTTTLGSIPVNWAQVSSVNAVDADSLPGNCSSTTTSCIEDDDAAAPAADLFLSQSVNNLNPNVDSNVIFTITVGNSGIAGTTNVQVKDLLPSGLTYVSDNGGGTYNKTSGIWTVGTLASGSNRSLNITAKVTANGIKTNLAEVWRSDESDPDSVPANNSTTEDDDASAVITSFRSIIINEVAWAGTGSTTALANDEWIELYNPSNAAINITGWTLTSTSLNVTLSGSISAGGYFLLERDDNSTVSDVSADQIYTSATPLSDNGEVITLRTNSGFFIDTANSENGGTWPKGTKTPNFASMERLGTTAEKDSSWITNTGNPKNGKNASGGLIYGTPKKANSRVVASNSTPIPTPTPTLLPVVGRPVISEFLPRPGFDWNQDGKVDVFDEFIEVKNLGPVDISIKGWKLDDEANLGSAPFTIPDITLKPGQRVVFYSLETNILLSDGGDTVRLLNPNNVIYDAYTYSIARSEDRSICRLPDSDIFGDWYEDCIPTPNLANSREGTIPSMPGEGFESPVCELPDTLPADFLFAECHGYGANIWDSYYWDQYGWGDQYVPENMSKWESFVE